MSDLTQLLLFWLGYVCQISSMSDLTQLPLSRFNLCQISPNYRYLDVLIPGLFLPEGESLIPGQGGVFKTGQFYILGIQTLTVFLILIWTLVVSALFLKVELLCNASLRSLSRCSFLSSLSSLFRLSLPSLLSSQFASLSLLGLPPSLSTPPIFSLSSPLPLSRTSPIFSLVSFLYLFSNISYGPSLQLFSSLLHPLVFALSLSLSVSLSLSLSLSLYYISRGRPCLSSLCRRIENPFVSLLVSFCSFDSYSPSVVCRLCLVGSFDSFFQLFLNSIIFLPLPSSSSFFFFLLLSSLFFVILWPMQPFDVNNTWPVYMFVSPLQYREYWPR